MRCSFFCESSFPKRNYALAWNAFCKVFLVFDPFVYTMCKMKFLEIFFNCSLNIDIFRDGLGTNTNSAVPCS